MPVKYYVESFRADGSRILGTLDGQAVLRCRRPERTAHVRRLRLEPLRRLSLDGRAVVFRVVDERGRVVMTIDRQT